MAVPARRPQSVVVFDMEGTILEANPTFLTTMGYYLEELQGKHHSILVKGAYGSEYAQFWEALRRGEYQSAEFRRIGKGGKEVCFWATYTPILDESGRAHKVVKIGIDVTEEKLRAADYASQIDAIRTSHALITFSMSGEIIEANAIFLDTMRYTLEEIQGKHHRILVPAVYAASNEYVRFWERLNRGEFWTDEYCQISKGGKEVWWHATFTPHLDLNGLPYKVVTFATDLTEQKRRYSELDRQKSMFLANMSHEIRTPMNGIFGMLSLLHDQPLDTSAKSYVDTCMRSAESLLAVLNDILLFSKADAGAIQLEQAPFNLNSVVEDVLSIVSSNVLASQDIDITYFMKRDVPLLLIGDASRLRQILSNLLSNAVKFTKYGEVSLDVSVLTRRPFLLLKFDVNDTGIGISEHDQALLFSPFTQVDATVTRQYGGTGLGLSICKHLVALCGGQISVQSRPGRGSTFSFTAKFKEDPAYAGISLAAALEAGEDTSFLVGRRVLIIDDNATSCASLECTLQQLGCDATSCRSGMDGIALMRAKALQDTPIELLLLDYHMPQMSGIDVAQALARYALFPKIIALASSIDFKLASEANIMAFSAKPIRRGQLLHMIRSVLLPTSQAGRIRALPITLPDTGSASRSSLSGLCVLIAEDNEINRKVVGHLLKQEQCRVIEAVNGVEALDKMSDSVQVVLMDVHMPVLDGIAATKLLLKMRPSLPIVYLTADVSEETDRKCQESGARSVLRKPVNKAVLMKALQGVLGTSNSSPLLSEILSTTTKGSVKIARFCCLIVDDVNTNRVLAAHYVRKVFGKDIDIGFADSGLAAIQYLSERMVELILMDVKMPGMSGIETTRRIRELALPKVRIVGVTGFDDQALTRECLEAGMDGVLTKPLREIQLRSFLVAVPTPPLKTVRFDDSVLQELDIELRDGLAREWISVSLEMIARMKKYAAGQEWNRLLEVAHTLKGSSAQLGAISVSEAAARVHELGRVDSGAVSASGALEELESAYKATAVKLRTTFC